MFWILLCFAIFYIYIYILYVLFCFVLDWKMLEGINIAV